MSAKYIAVDLDGTLVRGDMFLESCLRLLSQNIFYIFMFVFWGLKGRARLKEAVAERVSIEPDALPFEQDLLDALRRLKANGAKLLLATAAHRRHAETVAAHVGIFDAVIASDGTNNLKGSRKLTAIREFVGGEPFVYAGNSRADRPLWAAAEAGIFVDAPRRDVKQATREGRALLKFDSAVSTVQAFFKAIRPHQFAKNLLVFVPLFTSHQYVTQTPLLLAILAWVSFCFCAAGVYLMNDLMDLHFDRLHPQKRFRPLAAGTLPIPLAVSGAVLMPAAAFLLALVFLPFQFAGVLAGYYALTVAYSLFLKRISTVDVMTLAALYTVRVLAGAVAIGVVVSAWLMAFSIFFFVSLAYLKRYVEIAGLNEPKGQAHGRQYSGEDKGTLYSLGVANMTAAVIVLTLFVNSDEIRTVYANPDILWCLCFLVLFWGNRIWMMARRGLVSHDPVVFALKDRGSLIMGCGLLLTVLAAKFLSF